MDDGQIPEGVSTEDLAAFERVKRAKEEHAERRRNEANRKYQEAEAYFLAADKHSPWVEVDCSFEGMEGAVDQGLDDAREAEESNFLHELGGNRWRGVDERPYVKRRHADDGSRPTVHQFYDDLYCLGALRDIVIEDVPEYGPSVLIANDLSRHDGILVNHIDRDDGEKLELYQDYVDFLTSIRLEPSYIYLGRFINRSKAGVEFLGAKKNQMLEIGGFCVDIDRTEDENHGHYEPAAVIEEVTNALDDNPELMPTYLMLSGTGIQLWYVFGQRIPLLNPHTSPRRFKYEDVLRRLYAKFDELLARAVIHVDMSCATLCHGFRAPGSPAKGGYPTRLFARDGRGRTTWDPLYLSKILGGSLEEYDVGPWNQGLYEQVRAEKPKPRINPATDRQRSYLARLAEMGCIERIPADAPLTIADADMAIKAAEEVYSQQQKGKKQKDGDLHVRTTKGHDVAIRHRDSKLYAYTLGRIKAGDSKPGTRYNALVALAGIAWNCQIPKDQLKGDMLGMLDLGWAKKAGVKSMRPLEKADVMKALKSYNVLGALRPREQIEYRLGWEFGPSAKRNGRDRRTHLWGDWTSESGTPQVNVARENRKLAGEAAAKRQKRDKVSQLASWLESNPCGSKRSACAELHMSRTTVTKYWSDACNLAGIKDVRTGNHGPESGFLNS